MKADRAGSFGLPGRGTRGLPQGRALAAWLGIGIGLLVVVSTAAPGALSGVPHAGLPLRAGPWVPAATVTGTWQNGVIRVDFPTSGPTMTISSIANPRVETTVGLHGLAEVAPNGSYTVYASFDNPNATWHVTPKVGAHGSVDLTFQGKIPEVQTAGVWESGDDGGDAGTVVGNASVRTDVYLNGSLSPSASAARISVQANWTWESPQDSLGLSMSLHAARHTRIASGIGPSGTLLQELANSTGKPVASLSWARAATVRFGTGINSSSSVASYATTVTNGSNSTVRLLFGNVSGGYDSVDYDPWIALNLGAFVVEPPAAWSIGVHGWIVLGAALATVSALAVVAARRHRSQPDELG